jgi:Rad3-related DNA helicase
MTDITDASPASAAALQPTPFPFPFPPYPQQYELMTHVLQTIQKGKGHVAVVESPTGTGQ